MPALEYKKYYLISRPHFNEKIRVWLPYASVTADGKMIKLAVPAETLSDGDYSFVLSGIPASGASENVARYYFRVTHQ